MLRLGLTGSIASGKSLVTSILRSEGFSVIDGDVLTHEVCEAGQPGAAAIANHFGPSVMLQNGTVDRAALGAVVFSNPQARADLEALLHPIILAKTEEQFDQCEKEGNAVVFFDAAMLIESGYYREMDRVWLVVCDDPIRLQRLMNRDGFDKDKALRRIESQMPQDEKRRYADALIDNSGDTNETKKQVLQLLDGLKTDLTRKGKE